MSNSDGFLGLVVVLTGGYRILVDIGLGTFGGYSERVWLAKTGKFEGRVDWARGERVDML